VIAPQRQQVIDLEPDGFLSPQTVSEFLTKQSMSHGAIVLVDEAGQIGAKQMQQLLRFVRNNSGRVILSGDTRQHGAVEASDALRAIELYSGLRPAELKTIHRQNPALAKTQRERKWIEQYKLAVQEASEGKMRSSFDRLDQQGAIIECFPQDRQTKLAEHYLQLAGQSRSIVIVSQTWSEIHKLNEQVRSELQTQGLIGKEVRAVSTFESVDLTNAQKRDQRFYTDQRVVVFNRSTAGFDKSEVGRVIGINSQELIIESADKVRAVKFKHLDHLTVCETKELLLTSGDRLQLKANSKTRDGSRLANGELVTVKAVGPDGRIRLEDGRILEKDYRQFVRGYAVTSYAAQGKTVDFVLFSDSAVKAATNKQQWYVTISRGRRGIRIFTSDKRQLRENVLRSGDRELAIELGQSQRLDRRSVRNSLAKGCVHGRVIEKAMRRRVEAFIASRRSPHIKRGMNV
jgi:hypothetical protein